MDWVIVEPVDDRYWLCAIKDGAPLPGLDIMGTYEEISEAGKEFSIIRNYITKCSI